MYMPTEQFVRIWQQASTSDEVVAQVGGRPNSVHCRARSLRLKGVNLKKFPKKAGKSKNDIAALNRIATDSLDEFEKSKLASK